MAVLPGGRYVASHDFFGPGTDHNETCLFTSKDQGATWSFLGSMFGQWWSSLFVHRGRLYLLGTSREYGPIVIRRSEDGGHTWTNPRTAESGLLRDDAAYHCAPVPVVEHEGRLWRAFELVCGQRPDWAALVISAPADADLLSAENWRMSQPLYHLWSRSQWIEGNVVVSPDGALLNVLRTNGQGDDRAAIVQVPTGGRVLAFDRSSGLIDFPGGGTKFSIRYHSATGRYWSIANQQTSPAAFRNHLVLTSSVDLRVWTVERTLLCHRDPHAHAWQYVDWLFEGDEIIALSRTAYDDGLGGARDAHDANYLTFHRFAL
jgi:hypothetical protein